MSYLDEVKTAENRLGELLEELDDFKNYIGGLHFSDHDLEKDLKRIIRRYEKYLTK